ncbi:MAG TPA: hypothetical protein VJY62_12655 [Bacteroidia bacterium]|nr:hypothetical protein [Bacteroidia bacterium]
MKNYRNVFPLLTLVLSIMLFTSCKKDDPEPSPAANNNNNDPCNYTTNVLVVDGNTKNIVSDSCRVFGSNYYTEYFVDAGKTEGIAIIFNGTSMPAAGTYTAVNTFTAIASGKAYVEYYSATSAYQPASGTITITNSGNSKIYTFCNFSCTDGTTTKTISVRATCN